jgi:phosphoribosylglycinamide formyltransferase 1
MPTKPITTNTNLAIFASGSGTNAQNICTYFKQHPFIKVVVIVTNNHQAGIIERAKKLQIPVEIIPTNMYSNANWITHQLLKYKADYVILAGYLKLVPTELIKSFTNRIINIHPALLPKHGGKGMYGMKVHNEVRNSGDKTTGITVHYVNEHFDEGEIIFQAETVISEKDTPELIADKVHKLEYRYYPKVIEKIIQAGRENK